ncbi:MAG TPA: glycine-rich protein [Baekduia sp.]|uniref:glycine-rich protein n=1 Tax=Baekduia sp. TaxID=2600305 RepID=UPI002D78BD50|nr:glycine-rich protein [Baekduia sp.]HET6509816.1 glycine-rich protein [Baekduia sp.]
MPRPFAVLIAAVCSPLLAAPSALASGQTTTFTATLHGSEQTYVVPLGTTLVHVDAAGASGGGESGGIGGRVVADLPVTPGQVLYVEVGKHGHEDGTTPGWNGGGVGTYTTGGGASDVRLASAHGDVLDPTSLASRVVVAGGGGGASFYAGPVFGGNGGAPGDGPDPGLPGTATAGGAGGIGGDAGRLGAGGDSFAGGSSGGGGGGLYGGGGGGDFSGGGGGASGIVAPATNATYSAAAGAPLDGTVSITTGDPAVTARASALAFGARPVGDVGAKQLTIDAGGSGPLTILAATLTGDGAESFLLGAPNCQGFVTSCAIPVLFSPTAVGAHAATVSVATNDPRGPLLVALSGTGVAETAPATPATAATTAPTPTPTPAPAPAPAPTIPAKRLTLLTCHAGTSQRKPALRCRAVSVPAGTTLPGKSVYQAKLSNRSTTYATGTARVVRGSTQVLLTPSRRIAPGRYTRLTLTRTGAKTLRTALVVG